MRKRKWERGDPMSWAEAIGAIVAGNPVYYREKWTHNGWARSWPLNMIISSANMGWIFRAVKIEEDENDQ